MQTILVIENDGANRENILRILRFTGFRGIGAENGEIGVEMAKRDLPQLILCDILMPGLDGYVVLETLGRSPATQTIPVIFITAKATPSDVQYAQSLGVDGYLCKPFGSSQLLEAIATCLTQPIHRQAFSARMPQSTPKSTAPRSTTVATAVAADLAHEYPFRNC